MMPPGAIGEGWRDVLGLHGAGAIGRPNLDRVVARGGVPRDQPLDPRRIRDRRGEAGGLPGALVDRDLDTLDAAVRRPGDTGDRDRAGGKLRAVARDVDPGL